MLVYMHILLSRLLTLAWLVTWKRVNTTPLVVVRFQLSGQLLK